MLLAGGSGQRFGGPKQHAILAGRSVLSRSLETARRSCDGVVAVIDENTSGSVELDADVIVVGGPTRSASVRAGLAEVPVEATVVVVHDAARPLAGPAVWAAVLQAVAGGADGAIPVVAVTDTIRQVGPDGKGSCLDRFSLLAVQTPQAFRAEILRRAHAGGQDATDDSTLVEAIGGRVVTVEGQATNVKITTPSDLLVADALLSSYSGVSSRDVSSPEVSSPAVSSPAVSVAASARPLGVVSGMVVPRVGLGFDIHPFSADPSRRLVLGGVFLEGPGLDGHSDADVVTHAVADALLGAAGLGDIGSLFPSTDPALAGADSLVLLGSVVGRLAGAWTIGNVDVTVVTEVPRLAPRQKEIESRLSGVVGAPVTVKPKRPEALGALGRREGVVAMAVALVIPR